MRYGADHVKIPKNLYSETTVIALVFMILCVDNVHAQESMPLYLNNAIAQSARSIEGRVPAATRVAILEFSSDSETLSDYIIDKLSGEFVNNNKLTVIERKRPDLIRNEIALQLSGDVDDDYMIKIGKQWGAQVIIYGSLRSIGDTLSFMIKSVNVETVRIEAQVFYAIDRHDPIFTDASSGEESDSNVPLPGFIARMYDPAYPTRDDTTVKTRNIGDLELGSWFSFYNPTGANDGDLRLGIDASIAFTRAFTDTFSLNILLNHYSGINTGDTANWYNVRDVSSVRDFLYLRFTPSWFLPMGPGVLRLSVQLMPVFHLTNNYDFFYRFSGYHNIMEEGDEDDYGDEEHTSVQIGPTFIFNPLIQYRLDALIGSWWFILGTSNMGFAEGADYDKKTKTYSYGLWINDLYASVELGLYTGLSFWASSYFFINTNAYQPSSFFRKVRVGMEYDFNHIPVSVGMQADVPIGTVVTQTTMDYWGISLIPYARVNVSGVAITVNFYINHVGADSLYRAVVIMPEIGMFYSFHL
ncbi:MAG: penicillin-binding protein activator LpoB [Treponema sp.]|nr:penicillin-binding protein activator LpoB [Treponema sp.]